MSASNEKAATAKVVKPKFVYFTRNVHHEAYDRISPLKPENSAHGKNILVTGGGTGIGKSIAISFAQAGAQSVWILGRRQDRLAASLVEIKAAATNPASVIDSRVADLMDPAAVDNTLQQVVARVGKIDILVSNAAALPPLAPLAGYNTNDFLGGFSTNVLSAFNAVHAFLPLAAPSAMIINISAALAHIAPVPGASAYAISKSATVMMMDYFAVENPKLHVVSVQSGTVDTEMSAKIGVKASDSADLPGNFCVCLASPEARFLKGKFVWANWDVDELVARSGEIENSRLLTFALEGL